MRLPTRQAGIVADPLLHDRADGRLRQEGPRVAAAAPARTAGRAAAAPAAAPAAARRRPRRRRACRAEDEIWAAKTVAQLNKEGVLADVFFDLDIYGIREDARAPLQRNAEYLKRWPSVRHHRRRPLRRAGHGRVQPEPR